MSTVKKQNQYSELLKGFVFMEELNTLLSNSITQIKTYKTANNILLYGDGGYGKSEYAMFFYKSQGYNPFVLTGHKDLSPSDIYGGYDIKLLNETGEATFNLQHSMFNHEIVILEELGDMPLNTISALKDALSSGYVRNGNQQFQIKTKLVVATSNLEASELSKNASLEAVFQRFPLQYNVYWKSHSSSDYAHYFQTKYGKDDIVLSEFFGELAKIGRPISPRVAGVAYKYAKDFGYEGIYYILPQHMTILRSIVNDKSAYLEAVQSLENISTIFENAKSASKSYLDDYLQNKITRNEFIDSITEILTEVKDLNGAFDNIIVKDGCETDKLIEEAKTSIKYFITEIGTMIHNVTINEEEPISFSAKMDVEELDEILDRAYHKDPHAVQYLRQEFLRFIRHMEVVYGVKPHEIMEKFEEFEEVVNQFDGTLVEL